MNVILDMSTFSLADIFFTDKKQNVLIKGYFTKLIYSNHHLVISNIYYLLPFITQDMTVNNREIYIQCDMNSNKNITILQTLADIEYRILNHYKRTYNLSANISTNIDKKLKSGILKMYNEGNHLFTRVTNIVIKISGIWETTDEIGLAIKFCPGNVCNLSN